MAEPPTPSSGKCTQAATLELLDCSTGSALDSKGLTIHALLAALTGSFASFGAQVLVFSIVRSKCPRVYQHRQIPCGTPEKSPRFFRETVRWIFTMFTLPNKVILEACGPDAFFFLRYVRLLLYFFLPLSVVVTPTLAAINRYAAPTKASVQGLDRFSLANMSRESHDVLWAHLFLAVGTVSWLCFVVHTELRNFVKIRQEYLQSLTRRNTKSTRTILVTHIPQAIRNVASLQKLYDVYPGGVAEIVINRDHRVLSEKVAQCERLRDQIEEIETSHLRACVREMSRKGKEIEHAANNSAHDRNFASRKRDVSNVWLSEEHFSASLVGWNRSFFRGRSETLSTQPTDETESLRRARDESTQDMTNVVGNGPCARLMKTFRKLLPREMKDPHTTNPILPPDRTQVRCREYSNDAKKGMSKPDSPKIGLPLPAVPVTHSDSNEAMPQSPCAQWMNEKLETAFYRRPCARGCIQGDSRPTWWEKNYEELLQVQQSPRRLSRQSQRAGNTDGACPNFSSESGSCHVQNSSRPANIDPLEQHRCTTLVLNQSMHSNPNFGEASCRAFRARRKLVEVMEQVYAARRDTQQSEELSSAFLTFSSQAAAHMACQNLIHHEPLGMTSSVPDIVASDVLWENLARGRLGQLVRKWVSTLLCAGIVVLYTIPVSFASMLAQLDRLARTYPWLGWLDDLPPVPVAIIQGVLPPLLVGIMLVMIPPLIRNLAALQGVLTGRARETLVQSWYFAFLFVQCFLVVTVSGGLTVFFSNLASEPGQVVNNLSQSLSRASNYFFSYLTVQALSSSASALLQVGNLGDWLLLGPFLDSTPRQRWRRQEKLGQVQWGTMFPPLSNIAAIGIIYSIIAPLMLMFMTFIFSLFWLAYRYNVLFVYRYDYDYGGLMFPTAVHQLFTGVYVLEACLAAYFFTMTSVSGHPLCIPQGVIMVLCLLATGVFQWRMKRAFGGLITFLPVSLAPQDQRNTSWPGSEQRRAEQGEQGKMNVGAVEHDQTVTNRNSERGSHESRHDESEQQAGKHRGATAPLPLAKVQPREDHPLKGWFSCGSHNYRRSEHLSYAHPATQAGEPVIWIPKDPFGVSQGLVRRYLHQNWYISEHGRSNANDTVNSICTSDEGAHLDTRGRIEGLQNLQHYPRYVSGRIEPDGSIRSLDLPAKSYIKAKACSIPITFQALCLVIRLSRKR